MSVIATHRVKEADRARIGCSMPDCDKPADLCEHTAWDTGNTRGLSFFYFCDDHTTGGSNG